MKPRKRKSSMNVDVSEESQHMHKISLIEDIPKKNKIQMPITILNSAEDDIKNEIGTSQSAWYDDEDEVIDIGCALKLQKRKLPNKGIIESCSTYSSLLKNKFDTIIGTPTWSKLNKKNNLEISNDKDTISRSNGFISSSIEKNLPSSVLEFKKVLNLNSDACNKGPTIDSVEFHPSLSVALVAGNNGIMTLYSVDGKKNSKLHSVSFDNFPIVNAKFVENGNEVILGSKYAYIYTFDLNSMKYTKCNLPTSLRQCKRFIIHPENDTLAVAGKWGQIHLLTYRSKETISVLKQNGEATGLAFTSKGDTLFTHSDTGIVSVWDMRMRRIKHSFIDESCISGTSITASSSNQFLATGSSHGIVNLYNMYDVIDSKVPKPIKSIYNLTTSISNLIFNHSSEMLALSSSHIPNSIKLFHLKSKSVFNNFPSFSCKLGHITSVAFSPQGGYLAISNRQNVVALYHLKHFKNY